jgi:hypothetical protein
MCRSAHSVGYALKVRVYWWPDLQAQIRAERDWIRVAPDITGCALPLALTPWRVSVSVVIFRKKVHHRARRIINSRRCHLPPAVGQARGPPLLPSVQTLRFELFHRAAGLVRPDGALRVRLANTAPIYAAAKRALAKVRAELRLLNASAAASLDEGLQETLMTLHQLGLFRELGVSLKTTNLLESIHAQVEARTAKVDRWTNSDQKQRWVATTLLDLEPTLHRIKEHRAPPLLRQALRARLEIERKSA